MNISSRLKSVANLVAFKTCVDVGTDHGYVPIYLCLNSNNSTINTKLEIYHKTWEY